MGLITRRRRPSASLATCLFFILVGLLFFSARFSSSSSETQRAIRLASDPILNDKPSSSTTSNKLDKDSLGAMVNGKPIMPHLGNETAKAELGRATWKFLHTTLARYPEEPSDEERDTLKSFIYLFSRVYPCGECAVHFQKMLKDFPPQTSSRKAASQWGCFLHNQVNERLEKPLFDCNKILEEYDCGCGGDPDEDKTSDKDPPSETDMLGLVEIEKASDLTQG